MSRRPVDRTIIQTEVEFCTEQAQEQLRLAELTELSSRRAIHATAAQRWIRLAERARRVERRSVPAIR